MRTCTIADCTRKHLANGWCKLHYYRNRRYGSPTAQVRKVHSWDGVSCRHTQCDRPADIKGLCEKHYTEIRRHSDPLAQKRRNIRWQLKLITKKESLMGRPRPKHCELCHEDGRGRGNKPESGICFDHDHATGKPRGWLCDRCNKILGLARDDPALLRKLAEYLEAHHVEADCQAA